MLSPETWDHLDIPLALPLGELGWHSGHQWPRRSLYVCWLSGDLNQTQESLSWFSVSLQLCPQIHVIRHMSMSLCLLLGKGNTLLLWERMLRGKWNVQLFWKLFQPNHLFHHEIDCCHLDLSTNSLSYLVQLFLIKPDNNEQSVGTNPPKVFLRTDFLSQPFRCRIGRKEITPDIKTLEQILW